MNFQLYLEKIKFNILDLQREKIYPQYNFLEFKEENNNYSDNKNISYSFFFEEIKFKQTYWIRRERKPPNNTRFLRKKVTNTMLGQVGYEKLQQVLEPVVTVNFSGTYIYFLEQIFLFQGKN